MASRIPNLKFFYSLPEYLVKTVKRNTPWTGTNFYLRFSTAVLKRHGKNKAKQTSERKLGEKGFVLAFSLQFYVTGHH